MQHEKQNDSIEQVCRTEKMFLIHQHDKPSAVKQWVDACDVCER